VILSDRTLREELSAGRIVIEPFDEGCVQPSSIDLHVDRFFRVFRNDTTPYIDPKQPQEDLTELVEVEDGKAFILHPGEFVLGSTLERVRLPHDLVARLEGKSSLGRLGLLIHSSLPASETVLVLDGGRMEPRPIGEVVGKRLEAFVAAFDPQTFAVDYHRITGWYEGPADRIYEVRLASGRSVRVTAGHNLFTLDRHGQLAKVRTGELRRGARVAIPRAIPDPTPVAEPIDVLVHVPEALLARLVVSGPTVERAWRAQGDVIASTLRALGYRHVRYYRDHSRLPLAIGAHLPGLAACIGPEDRVDVRGGRRGIPAVIQTTPELAWLLGMFVAEGHRRANQFTISNNDQVRLDRVEAALAVLGLPVSRTTGAVTCCSSVFSDLLGWIGTGGKAAKKRIPPIVFSWPRPLMESFLEGVVDGDGSREPERTSVWTSSPGLVADLLLLAERLGRRAGVSRRERDGRALHQVYLPEREHKLLTSVPLPDRLLFEARRVSGLAQNAAARLAGYSHGTDLNNIERRRGRDAVRLATLRRVRRVYASKCGDAELGARLGRLVDGDLAWDVVTEVRDTGEAEPIYDLEVRPGGRTIENFVAGSGGVFVSNTAGFVDAGWDGHLTLELSNVANLPIAIYPGMKIGQISFIRMTSEAEHPYGSGTTGSKYQGQRGPTPSRYYLNFVDGEE
jgi:dCTP deaminase